MILLRNIFLKKLANIAFVSAMIISCCNAFGQQQLTVGLYPYVPRVEQFRNAILIEWNKIHPDIQLKFLSDSEWDGGYEKNPSAVTDVYVFDATYLNYFMAQNWLEPIDSQEIQGLSDFLPYSSQGVKVGDKYFAIPQLGCASLLFYNKNDVAMSNVSSVVDLSRTLNQCTYTSRIPPDRRGLMVDMSGSTTTSMMYLNATYDLNGIYPFPLPPTQSDVNKAAISNLRNILNVGSILNATKPTDNPYQDAVWFSNGWGRAYVGYSESMSQMTEAQRSQIAFKIMPLADNQQKNPPFYADVIGINTTTNQRGTRQLAVELANLMASQKTMIESIDQQGNLPPQYLLPTRKSVLNDLAQRYPIYQNLSNMISSTNPIMFKLDEKSREWLTGMKKTIQADVLSNPTCGCDYKAAKYIADQSSAADICNATCSSNGGWNGNWTNQYPAAESGSVCGCNSCNAVLTEDATTNIEEVRRTMLRKP